VGLRLEGGRAGRAGSRWRRIAARLGGLFGALVACLIVGVAPVLGTSRDHAAHPVLLAADGEAPVAITVDLEYETVNTGDAIFFDTVITNPRTEASPPLIVAMNIINLDQEGDVVDPEDWSPERTQYLDQLEPGASAALSWRVNAILDGDYIVYMVAMPEPAARDATSQAVSSSGIHLTVMPFTRLNPRGILPLVLGAPLVLGIGTGLAQLIRRRETEGAAYQGASLRLSAVGLGVVVSMGILSAVAVASQSGPGVAPGQAASQQPSASGVAVALEVDTAPEPEDFAFVQTELVAPAGSTITLTLNNLTDADDEVGHNWVLVQPGQEDSVLANGIAAGDDKDWLDVDDPGIIAHTSLIEGADSDSVTFPAPPPGTYTFLCTFPEHHAGGMVGTLTIR
jgi:azurin